MDPPYADPAIEETILAVTGTDWLADEGLLIVGHSPRVVLSDQYGIVRRIKFRRLGDSCFSIFEPGATGEQERDAEPEQAA